MTVNDLIPLLRRDLLRAPLSGETVTTDTEAAASASGAVAVNALRGRILTGRDVLAASVRAQHVPGCVRSFALSAPYPSGAAVPSGVLRVLETRVYAAATVVPERFWSETRVFGSKTVAGSPLLRVPLNQMRRRGPVPGTFALEGGRLYAAHEGGSLSFDAVAPEASGDGDDLGLPDELRWPLMLYVLAETWAGWKLGKAQTARAAFARAIRPYLREGVEVGSVLADAEETSAT